MRFVRKAVSALHADQPLREGHRAMASGSGEYDGLMNLGTKFLSVYFLFLL
jgi:hypothetical protein